jgi:rifampicin phosphotransferase
MSDLDLDRPSVIDRPASVRYPVYTRGNVAEIWPGPATHLTYTTMAGMFFDVAWRKALMRFGAFDLEEFDSDHEECLGVFYGYPYLNVSIQRVFGVRMPGATTELIDASFFGKHEGVPPYEPDPRDASPEHTARITRVIGEVLRAKQVPKLEANGQAVADFRSKRPTLTQLSNEQLWQHADPLITTWFADLMEEHMFITSAASIPIGIVQAAAETIGDPGLAMRALSGLGDVASAAPSYAMWELSRSIASSPTLTDLFDGGVPGVLDRLRHSDDPAAAEFLQRFDRFLYDFGFRCTNEQDVGASTWETKPEGALVAIERMRLQPDSASPRLGQERLAAARTHVVAQMLDRVKDDPSAHDQLEAGLQAAAVWVPAREQSKFTFASLVHEARMALFELGARMVAAGVFDAQNDYVLLRHDELPEFLVDPGSWRQEIVQRRQWFRAMEQFEPPFVTRGVPAPPSQWRRRADNELPPVTVSERITGIAACPGIATGTARVLSDPSDGGELKPGDVLVARSTDPAWTPLFVSATDASRRIPDGATVTVNGTTGTVTVDALP